MRFRMVVRACVVATLTSMLFHSAVAGQFNEADGVAIKGHDPVAYFTANRPVKGDAAHAYEYKGSKFLFATRENRDMFAADPGKYAPQFDGYCAYGVAVGAKADIDPSAFSVVDGKLYLNVNPAVQKKWSGDIPSFIKAADEKWPEVSKQTSVRR